LLEKNKEKPDPWCLQDGVAPQADIDGLENNRVRVPSTTEMKNLGFNEYLCRGGKNAHFIGSYKWIFSKDLPGGLGIIKRR
jgi:hypothetical protein